MIQEYIAQIFILLDVLNEDRRINNEYDHLIGLTCQVSSGIDDIAFDILDKECEQVKKKKEQSRIRVEHNLRFTYLSFKRIKHYISTEWMSSKESKNIKKQMSLILQNWKQHLVIQLHQLLTQLDKRDEEHIVANLSHDAQEKYWTLYQPPLEYDACEILAHINLLIDENRKIQNKSCVYTIFAFQLAQITNMMNINPTLHTDFKIVHHEFSNITQSQNTHIQHLQEKQNVTLAHIDFQNKETRMHETAETFA